LRLHRRLLIPFVMCAALAAGVYRAGAEIIDRVLAVVDGALITQTDVQGAIRLGLVTVPAAPDAVPAALAALIERRLILAEVDRYAPPEPADAEVEHALDAVRARVGAPELDAALLQTGSSLDQLRRYLRDDLRVESYLKQRFGSVQPGEADIAQYYRDHAAEFAGRSLQEAHDAVVQSLANERRAALVRDWVAGLRRRANINILPR
jgi:hypothetical protein